MTIRCQLRYIVLSGYLALSYSLAGQVVAQESFQVTLNQDGETIGDMRPVFLQFESAAMPAISPREVARRYQRLFDQSDEPEVRIDALNRLANLQQVSGEELRFSPEREQQVYEEVLGSYDEILARGVFQGRLDELMYQMAKAHAYVGQGDRSIQRLKQLVGLYPDSPLVPEARFRIAEAAFSAASYAEAEATYKQVLASDATPDSMKSKARYMLGWSQYKQGGYQRAEETFVDVLDEQVQLTAGFQAIPSGSVELIDDTFRIIAIMAASAGGESGLVALLDRVGGRSYDYLLYDRLADYYVTAGDLEAGVAVSRGFIERSRNHASVPAFRVQIVDVLIEGGMVAEAREAKAAYVEAYDGEHAYQGLQAEDRQRWWDYARTLADFHYQRASAEASSVAAVAEFAVAADYYSQLAKRSGNNGEVLRLAGDAWLQADNYRRAREHYLQAAYAVNRYDGAADAAWAALLLQSQALDGTIVMPTELDEYANEAERFLAYFGGDSRVPELQADVANRMLSAGRYQEAHRFGSLVVDGRTGEPNHRYSAWLVIGESGAALSNYAVAENAWRKSLALATLPTVAAADEQVEAIRSQLATSVYRQGELAEQAGDVDHAVAHYRRIETVAPGSDLAAKGRFDAANTLLKSERWQPAINELQRFRQDYPAHPLTDQIGGKLVYAYQASGQPVRAADELLGVAGGQAAGDWSNRLRAAELYHQGRAITQRNDIYLAYLVVTTAALSAEEHVQQQQIRQRLVEDGVDAVAMREALVREELASDWHSEATLTWSAQAALALGEQAGRRFSTIALERPLARSLSRKQAALEMALNYYRQAERLGGDAAVAESLYRRGELYRTLARDLMASSRPQGLSELEAMQYDLLLEEQAYPFEEMAIDLHSKNHDQLAKGYFDHWVEQSLAVLAELHPGRYAREMRWMSWDEDGDVPGATDENDA